MTAFDTSGHWHNSDEAFFNIALGISEVIKELPAKTKEQWWKDASTYYRADLYEEALSACEEAIQLDPNYAQPYKRKGDVLYSKGEYEDALQLYEKAYAFLPARANLSAEFQRRFERRLPGDVLAGYCHASAGLYPARTSKDRGRQR